MKDQNDSLTVESLELHPELRKNKVLTAMCHVFLKMGNEWLTAKQIVAACHALNVIRLRQVKQGKTPASTIQGSISIVLSTATQLQVPPPISKLKCDGGRGTYYRLSPELFPKGSIFSDKMPIDTTPQLIAAPTSGNSVQSKRRTTNKKRKRTVRASSHSKKRKRAEGYKGRRLSSEHSNSKSNSAQSTVKTKVGPEFDWLDLIDSGSDLSDVDSDWSSESESCYVPNGRLTTDSMAGLDETSEEMESLIDMLLTTYQPTDFAIDTSLKPSDFCVGQQTGYSYPRLRNRPKKRVAKPQCEDSFCIKDLYMQNGQPMTRLFCIADGHGGAGCSKFLTERIPEMIEKLLQDYTPFQMCKVSVQEKFKQDMTEVIKCLDNEYLDRKREEFRQWRNQESKVEPVDDGATLVLNIFFGDWLINANVGDSRTVLAHGVRNKWIVDFASEDHKPYLERLAQNIFCNGGMFVDNNDKPIKFDPVRHERRIRPSLKRARIRLQDANNDLGIPYSNGRGINWSLNVAATIGDLLFKLDPNKPVVSCVPDVYFTRLDRLSDTSGRGFLLMSTDGLFDHMYASKPEVQNLTIATQVGRKIDIGESPMDIVKHLCNREGDRELFENTLQEYDDCTCILVKL
ncbi:5367_t:CDS:2 [Paraglomus brasilianum]|uniref:5367_t:CDS:1 n=1 Tax=Paraglomus brasilianum TaxID=144538 RepID=A0A9N8YZD5_9GLOM|nr:5367_t:CDS:2 [Paraglomus brasilianum]